MTKLPEAAPRRRRAVGLLTFLLAGPSLYVVEKYIGARGFPVYLLAAAIVAWAWEDGRLPALADGVGERRARAVAVFSFLLLIALFAVGYPLANSGRFGSGSDGDEALNQAARSLLQGRFPYHERTYLGNEITPMPGELVLAMPFVLLGNGAYQSLFWLAAGALALWACWGRRTGRTWLFCVLILAACPAVIHQLVTGSDYLANALMVLLPAVALVTAGARTAGPAELAALAALLGLALSSRGNYALVLPLVLSRLWQTLRPRTAALVSGAIVATAVGVTLPFYLYDPAGFSPLRTRRKLALLGAVLPHAEVILPVAALALALALSRRRWNADTAAFVRNTALVQGFLVVVPALLYPFVAQTAPSMYSAFGTLFLPFGVAAYAAAKSGGPAHWRMTRPAGAAGEQGRADAGFGGSALTG